MKALIINGSPRKNGATSQILHRVQEKLGTTCEVQSVSVYDEEIHPCIGCEKCRPDKTCVLPEDGAHRISRLINEADILVLGSPTYWGNVSGPLKTLFDRCVPVFEYIDGLKIPKPMQKGKKSMIVTVSNAPPLYNLLPSQSSGAIQAMKTLLGSGGYRIRAIVNVARSRDFDSQKDAVFKKVDRLVTKLI